MPKYKVELRSIKTKGKRSLAALCWALDIGKFIRTNKGNYYEICISGNPSLRDEKEIKRNVRRNADQGKLSNFTYCPEEEKAREEEIIRKHQVNTNY